MNIYRDPLQPDAFLVESANGRWFTISQDKAEKTEFIQDKLPPLQKAELVPVWLLESILDVQDFISSHYPFSFRRKD